MGKKLLLIIALFFFTIVLPNAAFAQTTVPTYDVFELTYTYNSVGVPNPWEDTQVSATFTPPSGTPITIDGFYYDTNTYKVRFNPIEVGTYTYDITINGPSGTVQDSGSFDATDSGSKGFIIKNPTNPYRLIYEDGTIFNGIGINDCWVPRNTGNVLRGSIRAETPVSIDEYLQTYANAGINLFRLSAEHCGGFTVFNEIYITTTGNQYDIQGSKYFDELAQKSKLNGMAVMTDVFTWTIPLKTATFGSPEADALDRFAKYYVARWGAYTDFWEVANEIPLTVSDEWIRIVRDAIRKYDPYDRMITNSRERTTDLDPLGLALDLRSPHVQLYDPAVNMYPIEIEKTYTNNFTNNAPIVIGEAYNNLGYNRNWDPLSSQKVRIGIWDSLVSGLIPIYWNTSYATICNCINMYLGDEERSYINVLQYIAPMMEGSSVTSEPTSSNGNIIVTALTSPTKLLAYAYKRNVQTTTLFTTTSFTVNVPEAGTAYWIEPKTGQIIQSSPVSSGSQQFTTPSFGYDIALLTTSGSYIPPTPPASISSPTVTVSNVTDNSITFDWNSVNGATSYQFELSNQSFTNTVSGNFSCIIGTQAGATTCTGTGVSTGTPFIIGVTSGTTVTASNLSCSTNYYVHIKSLNSDTTSNWSTTQAFATNTCAGGTPAPTIPPNTLTEKFFPQAGEGRVAFFGSLGTGCGVNQWNAAHDSTFGGNVNLTNTNQSNLATTGCQGNNAVSLGRGFLPFDTSSLPDGAVITDARLGLYVTGKTNNVNDGNDYIAVVQSNQPNPLTLNTTDFPLVGNTVGSDSLDISNIPTGTYSYWTLNATGLSWISTTGTTFLAIREGHDIANVWGNYTGGQGNGINVNMSELTGTNQDPFLEITYAFPSASVTPTPIPGDADNNGQVTITDFIIWKDDFTNNTSLSSDFDTDGTVTILDFIVWKNAFVANL